MTTGREAGGQERSAPRQPATKPSTEALAELVNAASALQAVNAAAAQEAMKVPDQRLDDTSEAGGAPAFTLKQTGVDEKGEPTYVAVDAEGNEVKQERGANA